MQNRSRSRKNRAGWWIRYGLGLSSAPSQGEPPMIDLHYWPTPNGKKVTILLEELGAPYAIKATNIGRGDQFEPEFLKFSPNNRMPALVDTEPKGGGAPVRLFESGAIMMYIAEKHGKFYPQEMGKKYDVIQWVMWQMGN